MTRQAFLLSLLTPFVAAACKAFGLTLPVWAKPKPNFDPIILSIVRRAMPKLIAFDVCRVQPMTPSPSGLIFAMRSKYAGKNQDDKTSLFSDAPSAAA